VGEFQLFKLSTAGVQSLPGQSIQIEKSLQTLFENNLDALLAVRFLASEYSTGPVHGGRIDTLGIDEDGSPVIIEYKRAVNDNVINQGLFYLDWLMDHRGDFELLVLRKLGQEAAKGVDWSAPRLLCIAGDFKRYDAYAVNQIARNIELLRYRKFGDDLLLLELVHSTKVARQSLLSPPRESGERVAAPVSDADSTRRALGYRLSRSDRDLLDVYEATKTYLQNLGEDVQVKELQYYIAFKKLRNFACLELFPQRKLVMVYLRVNPDMISLEGGFTRDVRKIGHTGTGDLEVTLRNMIDFERAKPLFERSYQES
jgi:predicted transport protein